MDIEYPVPTSTSQEEKEREKTPSWEVTHDEQLERIFDSLTKYNYAVVIGPSHAGKTTFLQGSLRVALERNGYYNSVLLDCMTALSGEIIPEITSNKSTIVLDEASRMVRDESFLRALKERVTLRYPTVICATLFDNEIIEESELDSLLSELHLGDTPDAITEFPLNMTEDDAAAAIRRDLPEVSSEFIEELIGLTTQPYLMRIITNAVKRDPHAPLNAIVYSVLQNTYVDQTLKDEARHTWQKVSSEPYPRGLRPLAEAAD